MYIIDIYGDYVEAFFTSAGELVDATGNYLYTEGSQVYNDVGEWVGELYSESGEFIEDTRDQIVSGATTIGQTGAIAASAGVVLLGLAAILLLYKVVK